MSAQYCAKCGNPLQSGAQFCGACGAPVGGASGPPGGGGPAPSAAPPLFDLTTSSGPPAASRPPDTSSLRAALGLQGKRSFLLQHEMLSGRTNYRVLDPEKRLLFTVRESRSEDFSESFLGSLKVALGKTLTYHWVVANVAGNALAVITIEVSEDGEVSTLSDSTGTPLLAVTLAQIVKGGPHLMVVTPGFTATAASPDGRESLEAKGNLMRHNFSILNSRGGEIAKIHEAWASVRDTFNLDLVGDGDPLFPLIFAILIDRGKQGR